MKIFSLHMSPIRFFKISSVFILIIVSLFADEDDPIQENKKQITVSAAFANFSSLDLLYSYSSYSGYSVVPNITIEEENDRFYESSNIKLTLIPRTPSADISINEPYYNRLAYLLSFVYEQQDADCYLLTSLSNNHSKFYAILNWYTYVNISVNAGGIPELLLFSLGPGMGYSLEYSKHHLRVNLATNLLAYTCRNNYGFGITQNYERLNYLKFILGNSMIQTPLSLQTILAGLSYDYDINEKLYINAHYDFRFIHNSKPRTLISSAGYYSLGIGFKL